VNSIVKRSIGLMIMVELQDINKLAKLIKIPSLDEHVIVSAMALHKIINSKYLNQCTKYRKLVTSHKNVQHRKP
jgi:UDP-glucose 6-dehydrogenase